MMYTAGRPDTVSAESTFFSPARATPSEPSVPPEPAAEPSAGLPPEDNPAAFSPPRHPSQPASFSAPQGITPLTAALWGIAAAGVWLGCSSGFQVTPSILQSCLSGALVLLFIGWCGFSAAGQAGCLAALLAEGIAAGCVAAGIWAEKGELLTLLPAVLLLPVTVWAAGNSIRNSGRIWQCLRRGKNSPNLKLYLLRMLLAESACGIVLAASWLLRR